MVDQLTDAFRNVRGEVQSLATVSQMQFDENRRAVEEILRRLPAAPIPNGPPPPAVSSPTLQQRVPPQNAIGETFDDLGSSNVNLETNRVLRFNLQDFTPNTPSVQVVGSQARTDRTQQDIFDGLHDDRYFAGAPNTPFTAASLSNTPNGASSPPNAQQPIPPMPQQQVPAFPPTQPINVPIFPPTQPNNVFMNHLIHEEQTPPQNAVTLTQAVPDYSHIRIKRLDLAHITRVLSRWLEFDAMYGVRLTPMQVVDPAVKNIIRYNNGLTEESFARLSRSDFYALAARETAVNSKSEFARVLKKSLVHLPVLMWSGVSPRTHPIFFSELLNRRDTFLRTLRILQVRNAEYTPDLDQRDVGTGHMFLSMIDPQYAATILTEIPNLSKVNYSNSPTQILPFGL